MNARSEGPLFDAAPDGFGSSRTFIATAALAVGLLTGFAGGYVTSQRNHAGSPGVKQENTETPLPAPEEPAQTYTETPIAEALVEVAEPTPVKPEVGELPLAEAEVPQPALAKAEVGPSDDPGVVSAAPRPHTPRAVRATRTGAIVVFSRPSGANVFLDERLVGSTPLSLNAVTAGTHGVRIALPEHRAWATSVNVTPGSSLRVAASLER